jgi:23S rRNA U2552 (ribose-2'-O)-methylase RlmE/FtsJ
MVTTTRGFPRFLPTLTEVVRVPVQPVEPPEDPAVVEAARREAFAQRMRARLREALDGRMQDVVAYAMLEQVDVIGDRLRLQMEGMVRDSLDTITERLRSELDDMVREAVDAVLSDDAPQVEPEPATQPAADQES